MPHEDEGEEEEEAEEDNVGTDQKDEKSHVQSSVRFTPHHGHHAILISKRRFSNYHLRRELLKKYHRADASTIVRSLYCIVCVL